MRAEGFSLLELLVAMAIIAILTALAWPGYGAVMQRAQRNEARLALLAIQHAEERHYQGFSAYTDVLEGTGTDGGLGLVSRSTNGSYSLFIELASDAQHYFAVARTVSGGRQSADQACAVFQIDDSGQRGARDASGRDNSATCWR